MIDRREEPNTQRPMEEPQISIVIVSWNVAEVLEGCLQSIAKNAKSISLQVIVVDNASEDDTVSRLRTKYPWVQVIANKVNIGFARANNQALKYVRGRYVFILNPDTVLEEGALEQLIACLESRPEVGMIGPRILCVNGEVDLQSARLLPTLGWSLLCDCLKLDALPIVGPWITRCYVSPYDYQRSQEVAAISGAAMMIRRSLVEGIGLFGESFIHCGEDIDLCYRVRKCGLKIMYLSDAVLIHNHGQSRMQAPVRVEINSVLSIQEYFNRCFGKMQGLCYRIIVQVIQVPITLLIGLLKILTGAETLDGLRRRLAVAKGIWCWRPVE